MDIRERCVDAYRLGLALFASLSATLLGLLAATLADLASHPHHLISIRKSATS